MRCEFSEVQCDDELSNCNNEPCPEKCRATCQDTKIKQGKRAGGDRDVGESYREVGEEAQRAPQLLLVAKLLQ